MKSIYSNMPFAMGLLLGIGLACLLAGCENNAADDTFNEVPEVSSLTLSPSQAVLLVDDAAALFVASGGTPPYYWTISDPKLGTIPETDANVVTYTRVAGAAGINVITVGDKQHWTASAYVSQSSTTNAL